MAPACAAVTLVGSVSFTTNVIPAKAGTQYTEQQGIAGAAEMPRQPSVYILASKRNGTIHIGVTSDLPQRTTLHKQDLIEGFTKRYGVHRLVYYEMHHAVPEAIRREKRLKKWNRAWKIRLVEGMNPEWADLLDEFWGEIQEGPADRARRHIGRDRVDM